MVTLETITKKYQSVYYLPDPTPLRMIIATALSPYMDGSPVWLMIVATTGSGKTELLKCLKKVEECRFLSNMTENTLLSGSRAPNKKGKKDADQNNVSLLLRIPKYGGMLVWPEFNTLLDERSEKKAAILSQLRSVYDGYLNKETGLGDSIVWDGRISVIGACTEKYFTDMEYLDNAGPRFIIYTLPVLNDQQRKEKNQVVQANEHLFEQTQIELQEMVNEFYHRKVDEGIDPYLEVPEEFDNIIKNISDMLGVALTGIVRSFKGELEDVYETPEGVRFYRSSRKLAQAMMLVQEDRVLLEDDSSAIIKLMFDTIPRKRRRVLVVASQYTEVNTKGLAHHLHLPTDTVKKTLEELNAIGMMTRRSGDVGLGDLWSVKPKFRDLFISYCNEVVWKNSTLLHSGPDDDDSDSQTLSQLSAFTKSDDETYNEEVKRIEDERVDTLFHNF